MEIAQILRLYASHPNAEAMSKWLCTRGNVTLHLAGIQASAVSAFMAPQVATGQHTLLFVWPDADSAAFLYHDLTQLVGQDQVLFYPSKYRNSTHGGKVDAAYQILRTEVMEKFLARHRCAVVTYPDAVEEKVTSAAEMQANMLTLAQDEQIAPDGVEEFLEQLHFTRVDYVYEPGQFARRGSIVDVFSYVSEYPYRIDFFGDEIESIRTFDVDTQLSREKMQEVCIMPEVQEDETAFIDLVPDDTILCAPDFARYEQLEFYGALDRFRKIYVNHRPQGGKSMELTFHVASQPTYHKDFNLVGQSLMGYMGRGFQIYICSDNPKQADRLRDIFADRHEPIVFTPIDKTLHEGFVDEDLQACFLTDHQIFDRFHKYNLRSDKARSGKMAQSIKEFSQFQVGDYVVHIDHGIGKFAGLVRIPNGDSTQEVIKLTYQNDDVVFVSIHSLHKLSKYKGKEGEPPRMSRLGTGAWEKIKENTKRKIKDIARDLIKLYAQRNQEQGFQFSPDSFMQHELEASFIYEDTPDQLKATIDVKADMESARPMDRLVCGDVGFGKTEVAIRAAFKAVADNKQVAVLVPTTVLAYQHWQTFGERLKQFPCRVEYLSRARSAATQKAILHDLKEGKIDILVGTHKLIGKNVVFKDLGLLIIDEEQKFGVSVKEKLRQLKVNVDTLTLTATPIPRTLQFSLMGARDLSVIHTPPPNRYPIQTEVCTFSEELIADAIKFELGRDGQVFFVNNRVQNLEALRDMVLRLVPDCRVCIGHGQMPPNELEQVIYGFVHHDFDVMLCTTIVENGIDMPNVNTIIINAAQNYGLSDLHQLRGRVGRSNRKAFCYLLTPPSALLTDEAHRRLDAIENFSELGSGINIALQDLDIRGAGNLLGAEQSGFIADLGYETYQKILEEAVQELRVEEFGHVFSDSATQSSGKTGSGDVHLEYVREALIESDLEMLFPELYVPGSAERMILYRELDNLESDGDVEAFRSRLIDRFGPIPPETEELLCVVPLRKVARQLGVEKVVLKMHRMKLFLVRDVASPYYASDVFGGVLRYATQHARQCKLREQDGKRTIEFPEVTNVRAALKILRDMRDA